MLFSFRIIDPSLIFEDDNKQFDEMMKSFKETEYVYLLLFANIHTCIDNLI